MMITVSTLTNNATGILLPHNTRTKPWLMKLPTVSTGASTPAVQRWLLPYADLLTVLFCIALLWCGLALKQAHWLQVQNNKLEQTLTQANQQLIISNQTIETQKALLVKLNYNEETLNDSKPPVTTITQSQSSLFPKSVTQQQQMTGFAKPVNTP
jgi:hypothetical protein